MSDHHHHHHDDECCAHEHSCCHEHEHEHSCCHEHEHEHNQEDFAHQLIELADEAWMELLFEKLKEQIKVTNGAQMDKLAKLVSDANHNRWQHKMGLNKNAQDFKEHLQAFFGKD
jgi:hypothetical protein